MLIIKWSIITGEACTHLAWSLECFFAFHLLAEAYTAANLARVGKLPVRINKLKENFDIVASLTTELTMNKYLTGDTCENMQVHEALVRKTAKINKFN